MGSIPSWDDALDRFQKSEVGVKLRAAVLEKAELAIKYFKNKEYAEALPLFQWVSVFGFFTHTAEEQVICTIYFMKDFYIEQYTILKNLASSYERYLQATQEDTTVALLWAQEAQRVKDTDVVQQQIARLSPK